MRSGWKETFRSWGQGPGTTETTKAENAERMVKDAVREHDGFEGMDIDVFAHGSYRTRTNVRQRGDVDICVRLNSTFGYDLPSEPPNSPDHFGIIPATVQYDDFKNALENALVRKFGRSGVERGNKAFDVHENSYRVDADVVAALEHRRYTGRYDSYANHQYLSGIELRPDGGGRIVNWPQQTYENGVEKNRATGRRYKAVIRILKRLRNRMQEDNVSGAHNIASFLIECLAWNVPDRGFNHEEVADDVRFTIAYAFHETQDFARCSEWGEVNELKYLFRPGQPWTREQANGFLFAAWSYVGFD